MFLLNSRLGLFTAAPSGFNTLPERPFSRSYGAILPSSLTRVIPRTLGFSHLAYLCRFAVRAPASSLDAFLGSVKSGTSLL